MVVVDDLDVVTEFFLTLGFKRKGKTLVEGAAVDTINGPEGLKRR
ncbi:VOC family protein [Halocatena halophila]